MLRSGAQTWGPIKAWNSAVQIQSCVRSFFTPPAAVQDGEKAVAMHAWTGTHDPFAVCSDQKCSPRLTPRALRLNPRYNAVFVKRLQQQVVCNSFEQTGFSKCMRYHHMAFGKHSPCMRECGCSIVCVCVGGWVGGWVGGGGGGGGGGSEIQIAKTG